MLTEVAPAHSTPMPRQTHWTDIPLVPMFGAAALFAVAFFNLIDTQRPKTEVGLDPLVLIKLSISACAGLYGTIGFLTDRRVRRALVRFPLAWMSLLTLVFLAAIPTALHPVTAFASWITLLSVLLAATTAMVQWGRMRALKILYLGSVLFLIGSWFAWLFVPGYGTFAEPIADGQFKLRMAGLAHPNTLGQVAAIVLVLSTVFWVSFGERSRWRMLVIGLAVGALLLSLSRASMLASTAALAITYRKQLMDRRLIPAYLLAALIGFALLVIIALQGELSDRIQAGLGRLTKSGQIEELTTATGRSEIWAESVRLIAERPLLGYGATSSKYLLQDYSSFTHNLVLNVALSGGVLAGLIALTMCLVRLIAVFRRPDPMMNAIVLLVLINGLVENVIFGNMTGLPTLLWIVGMSWLQFEAPVSETHPIPSTNNPLAESTP